MTRSYDQSDREFNATINFTALQSLSGQFKFNAILVEDGIVWPQNGATNDYVHDWTVRAMMNGVLGEEIVNGAWNSGTVVTRNVQFTVPVPPSPSPDIVPDSCRVVVLVYKVGSPLSSGAEIQQAEQWTLVSPDYVASMINTSPDQIAANDTPENFSSVLYNQGLMRDTYTFSLSAAMPQVWDARFTTENGTFQIGESDTVSVDPGDSAIVAVTINPNSVNGFGEAVLNYYSANNSSVGGESVFRLVTESGLSSLVLDASGNMYLDYLTASLDLKISGNYGIVSRSAFQDTLVNLTNFRKIFWISGEELPAFLPSEITVLENYLDSGGNLFIAGQDIADDVFSVSGSSQFAQSFMTNYLHVGYVRDASNFYLMNGYPGDPISDGITYVLSNLYERSPDIISPADVLAIPILKYYTGSDIGAVRVDNGTYRAVYLGIGFEQIGDSADRDSIMVRSIRWFDEEITGVPGPASDIVHQFVLSGNYPNPFNPVTTIPFSVGGSGYQKVVIRVFNVNGQLVRTLVNDRLAPGSYETHWDGVGENGTNVSSGIYFCELRSGTTRLINKLVLMR